MRASLEPRPRGRTLRARRDPRPAADAAVRPGWWSRAELEGERVASVERRGKYLVVRFESGRVLLVSPPDDGELPARPDGSPGRRPAHACCCQARRRIGRRLPRRPALRHVAARSNPASSTRYLAARLGDEPLGRGFGPAGARRRARGPARAAEGGAARPAHGRGPREHLRRRGALARADPPAATGARARRPTRSARSTARFARRSAWASPARARRCATTRSPTAGAGRCSTSSGSTAARASRATAAARRSRRRAPAAAGRGTAPPASGATADLGRAARAARPAGRRGRAARARCSRRSARRRRGSAAPSSRRSDRAASGGTRPRRRARSPRSEMPRESSSAFARTQKPHQRVV